MENAAEKCSLFYANRVDSGIQILTAAFPLMGGFISAHVNVFLSARISRLQVEENAENVRYKILPAGKTCERSETWWLML